MYPTQSTSAEFEYQNPVEFETQKSFIFLIESKDTASNPPENATLIYPS